MLVGNPPSLNRTRELDDKVRAVVKKIYLLAQKSLYCRRTDDCLVVSQLENLPKAADVKAFSSMGIREYSVVSSKCTGNFLEKYRETTNIMGIS